MNAAEITEKLGLHSLRNRTWYIQAACATSGDGLCEGLDWLANQLKNVTSFGERNSDKAISSNFGLEKYQHLVPLSSQKAFSQMVENVNQQSKTVELISNLSHELEVQPKSTSVHIYDFLIKMASEQSSESIVGCYLQLTKPELNKPTQSALMSGLTDIQKRLVNEYKIDLTQLN